MRWAATVALPALLLVVALSAAQVPRLASARFAFCAPRISTSSPARSARFERRVRGVLKRCPGHGWGHPAAEGQWLTVVRAVDPRLLHRGAKTPIRSHFPS